MAAILDVAESAWEELQREWEEQEKERQRERIRALIQSYVEMEAEASSLIGNAEGYLSEYDRWLDKIIRIYETDSYMIRGQIETEYNRVYDIAGEEQRIIISNYDAMIGDAVSLKDEIDKKIAELTAELNSI